MAHGRITRVPPIYYNLPSPCNAMLELLRIHDLALIEDLQIEFSPGMNVLTGETGAGKSFILKALNFLTGEKLGTDLVRPGKEKAVVEALFTLDDEDHILRRELSAETGRSRIYLDDRLCSQETVRALRPSLILHVSQHGQQKLLQPAFQAAILDDYLARPDMLAEKDRLTNLLADCRTRIKTLEQARAALEDKRDLLEYQQREIDKVAPMAGEEEELEARRATARNQTGIAENAALALAALHGENENGGIMRALGRLEKTTSALAKILDDFADCHDALAEIRASLLEMDAKLRRAAKNADQQADIEAIESRLYELAQLKRKLKRPLASIVALQREIEENLDFLDRCGLDESMLKDEERGIGDQLAALLARLNPARQEAARALSTALQGELAELGFSDHVGVMFEFSPHSLHSDRDDCVELRPRLFWQPNPGQPPQPLERIASGGELSRFLLAVISLMSKTTAERPTLIFDEVDSGVGGVTLNRVAESLARLASARQMLLITHWPQLAAKAERHFTVQKDVSDGQTYTRCLRLTPDSITSELARMAGEEDTGT